MTASDLHFETFLSLPSKQNFLIETANAEEFPITIKSFSGDILDFKFDESASKFSYEIPFDWSHLEHNVPAIKQTISLPKSFSIFKQGHEVDVYVEGEKIKESSILFDSSSAKENFVRLNISHEKIMAIQDKLRNNNSNKKTMSVEIVSGKQTQLDQLKFIFENGYSATISWISESDAGQKIPFTFSFLDENGNPAKDILFAYGILDSTGKELWSNIGSSDKYLGVLSSHGTSHEPIFIGDNGDYQLKLILTG